MPLTSPRVLLLQARQPGDPVLEEEAASFAAKLALPASSVAGRNLVDAVPSMREVRRFDAVTIGGSGDYDVSHANLPGFDRFLDLLRDLADSDRPTFASCFGFQCLVHALGGEVAYRPDKMELGTVELTLTPAGREDPLFGTMPSCFRAQMGHKDQAIRMPKGVPNLASSPDCPLQALRLPNRPFWASQFHPELDPTENRERYERYLRMYSQHVPDGEDAEELERRFNGPSHTEDLLRRFLDLVVAMG